MQVWWAWHESFFSMKFKFTQLKGIKWKWECVVSAPGSDLKKKNKKYVQVLNKMENFRDSIEQKTKKGILLIFIIIKGEKRQRHFEIYLEVFFFLAYWLINETFYSPLSWFSTAARTVYSGFSWLLIIPAFILNSWSMCSFVHSHVKVVFLPPNETFFIQPLNRRIIRTLKCKYTRKVVQKFITTMNVDSQYGLPECFHKFNTTNGITYIKGA